jgi:hypothetical protein
MVGSRTPCLFFRPAASPQLRHPLRQSATTAKRRSAPFDRSRPSSAQAKSAPDYSRSAATRWPRSSRRVSSRFSLAATSPARPANGSRGGAHRIGFSGALGGDCLHGPERTSPGASSGFSRVRCRNHANARSHCRGTSRRTTIGFRRAGGPGPQKPAPAPLGAPARAICGSPIAPAGWRRLNRGQSTSDEHRTRSRRLPLGLLHSSANPPCAALESRRQIRRCISTIDLTVSLGSMLRASAKAAFVSSILPAWA